LVLIYLIYGRDLFGLMGILVGIKLDYYLGGNILGRRIGGGGGLI
jgi:hypothetical protein